jgi:hypothetical protein
MAVQAKHAVSSTLLLSLLALAGCDKPADTPPKPTTAATPAAPPYVPPSADQLQQMVAPIALFPDKLVGQVLAGATYPAQIAAADQWVDQNPSLKGDALQAAEANQPWDVSVKSLTAFPSVLDQMAGNIQWTTSLGQAYANDPNDVMNAIQVMRVRAQQAGNLKSSPQLRVSTTLRAAPPAYVEPAPADPQVVYDGPPVIPPPPQTIVIEPAEPDVVYVPQYNPTVVYGAPVPVYPGWVYHEPAYVASDLVTTGAISFGIGVLVGAAVSHHHDWGWNSWGVNWGGPGYGGGWHRPAVVYNNTTYVTKSVTVVNNFGPRPGVRPGPGPGPGPGMRPGPGPGPGPGMRPEQAALAAHAAPFAPPRAAGPMTMPHFTHRDAVAGYRAPPSASPAPSPAQAMARPDFRQKPIPAQGFQAAPNAPLMAHQQAEASHQHGDAGRERAALAPSQSPQRMAQHADGNDPHGHQPPMQHADAAMARPQQQQAQRPVPEMAMAHQQQPQPQPQQAMHRSEQAMPQRDMHALDHAQAHAIRQDVQAMHQRPAERPQPQHMERHEQAAHHDNHDKREHHG